MAPLVNLSDLSAGSSALWGLFSSAFISSTLAPGASEVVLAYLISAANHPAITLILIATIGNTLGATTTWYLGSLASRRWPSDSPNDPKRHRAVMMLRKYGYPVLFFSWLPVVGDGFCFAAGWLNLSFAVSTLAIAVGKLARYCAVAWLTLQI